MSTSAPDPAQLLFGAAGLDDPYPGYAALREQAAVHDIAGGGARFVTRYDDVLRATRDHDTFSSDVLAAAAPDGTRMIIATDPPDHTKLRRLVTRPFHPAAIAELEPRIRAIADVLVDELIAANEQGSADLIDHLGAALPVIVIAEMLGIPTDRREEFRRWSDAALAGGGGTQTMGQFFHDIIEQRRGELGDDLISRLLSGAEPLTEQELIVFCITLLIAGNETTTNLVGNAATALFANPDQAERLWADPSLIPSAVEEVLRYDPPAQIVVRRATTDTTVAGTPIAKDSVVMLGLASANRDPRHFDDPESFDVARNPKDHIAFGNGIHLCLGAPLARLEARVVLETLVERVRDLRPNGPGRRKPNPMLRGFAQLPVTFATVG